jgi:hypothetical protein
MRGRTATGIQYAGGRISNLIAWSEPAALRAELTRAEKDERERSGDAHTDTLPKPAKLLDLPSGAFSKSKAIKNWERSREPGVPIRFKQEDANTLVLVW